MKKKLIAVALVAVLMLSLALSANAACLSPRIRRTLDLSASSASCSASISDDGKSISATMELWQGSSMLASWSDSDTSSVQLSGSVNVSSGQTYTLIVYGTVNGVSFEMPPLTKLN